MGVEPTADAYAAPATGFEDRGAHRDASTPIWVASILTQRPYIGQAERVKRGCFIFLATSRMLAGSAIQLILCVLCDLRGEAKIGCPEKKPTTKKHKEHKGMDGTPCFFFVSFVTFVVGELFSVKPKLQVQKSNPKARSAASVLIASRCSIAFMPNESATFVLRSLSSISTHAS